MNNTIKSLRSFIADYAHFADSEIIVPLSLWIMATFAFESFDTFPYLVITARVKRAGKTRLSELIGFTCAVPQNVAGASAPALFSMVRDLSPTIIWDEAEQLSSESANLMRTFLNVGYRKGQTIPRRVATGVIQWPTYCPKVFVLIGDVYDTLRDRSIIVEMQRGEPKQRFSYEQAKERGSAIAEEIKSLISENAEKITEAYFNEDVSFLTDRDEEIWRPIFALCRVLCPDDYTTLQRIAADLSADKTNPHRYTENLEDEAKTQNQQYGLILLRDLLLVSKKYKRAIPSAEALAKVKEIPTSPWRRYHSPNEINGHVSSVGQNGSGLTIVQMCYMLEQFGISPKGFSVDNKKFRGYSIEQIKLAAQKFQVTQ